MFDDAMAICEYPSCASLLRSNFSGGTSLPSRNLSIRLFQVSRRWNNFGSLLSSLSVALTLFLSTIAILGSSSASFSLSCPKAITMINPPTAKMARDPISLPNCLLGILPIHIIISTTAPSSAAVERFSNPMRTMKPPLTVMMNLNALLSTPVSVCIALSIVATASTTAPLAISEGWNFMPITGMGIHLWPSFTAPTKKQIMSNINDMNNASGMTSLKYLHFRFIVASMNSTPHPNRNTCLHIGPQ